MRSSVFIIILTVVSLLTFIPILTYFYFANDLQTPETIMNKNNTGVILLDQNGQPFFRFYEAKYSTFVPLNDISSFFQKAVIAVEDKEFYSHPGFSIKGIVGAVIADIKYRNLSYGGSTITQQLVKYSLLNSRKSFLRKYQEIVLAQEIERRFSKDQILEMYLNSVYLGEGNFGIEGAAKTYFNKSAKDLNLAEASFIAGLISAPSRYSPFSGDRNQALEKQKYVLDEMIQQGYITPEIKHEVLNTTLAFNENPEGFPYKAPHFAFLVKQELEEKFGEEVVARSGFVVKTTLNTKWQEYAENQVQNQVKTLRRNNVSNGSAVVIDPKTGEVKVLVGSIDWFNTDFGRVNVATSLRQPGSAFKPIVYLAALERGLITPATVLHDIPTTFEGEYKPLNYDRRFRGQVLVRRALANSLNIPAVEVISKVGVVEVINFANRLGITTLEDPSNYGLSLVLGAGETRLIELTNAYATIANNGYKNDYTTISEITDKTGNVIFKHEPNPIKVVDPKYTFLISSILSDQSARSEVFGNALTTKITAAVKTGTSETYRDSLTMGYTPSLAVGVWVGNNDGRPMDNIAGSLGAAPIWKNLIEKFSEGNKREEFIQPNGIISLNVCRSNGLLIKEATTSGIKEYFVKGTEPTQVCFIPKPSPSPEQTPSPPENQGDPEEKEIEQVIEEIIIELEEN